MKTVSFSLNSGLATPEPVSMVIRLEASMLLAGAPGRSPLFHSSSHGVTITSARATRLVPAGIVPVAITL